MSIEKFKKEILDTFLSLGGSEIEINVISHSGSDFGNALAQVNSSLGEFKITRERGLTFVDMMIPEKGYVRAEDISEEVLMLQRKGNWTLMEQLRILFRSLSCSHTRDE